MTLVEVIVVIVILGILAAILLPALAPHHCTCLKINCVNNLKQTALAFRIWAGDNDDKYPMQQSVTNGGVMEFAAGTNVWMIYSVMSNELSTPKVVFCPQDTKSVLANDFGNGFKNSNVSYFVGLNADQAHPQMILSGDDNFAIGGVPVKSGLLEVSTNVPISWTAARHKFAGNIGLVDGSVESVTIAGLTNLLHQTGVATNRLAIP
jgi:prepilin-type N-terminal cleavage/methylation domain-containing protein/prepilin-type processing-associated H-X9-DG protein